MADSYVCSGATMRCSMGTSQARLTVLPTRLTYLTGQPMANISDHASFVNLAPFGRCRSLGYPATAAATAAHHGHLTPMPCCHNTPVPWMGGKDDYLVQNQPALLKSSRCQCMWGGTISLVTDGQTDTGPADMNRDAIQEFDADPVFTEGLNPDDVLDGIQMALDVAGMIPLAGAVPDLVNAAISACRGNWGDAALSLFAAVPGVGDVAGGAKIVKNGVKIANKVKKGAETAEATAKVAKGAEKATKGADNVVSMAEHRAAKADKQIAESDNVVKGPWSKNTANNATSNTVQKETGVHKTDVYTIKREKVVNGQDNVRIEKHTLETPEVKTQTIENSIGDSGKIQPISGTGSTQNYNVGNPGADAHSNSNAYGTASQRSSKVSDTIKQRLENRNRVLRQTGGKYTQQEIESYRRLGLDLDPTLMP